jgi:hypothetical protein
MQKNHAKNKPKMLLIIGFIFVLNVGFRLFATNRRILPDQDAHGNVFS